MKTKLNNSVQKLKHSKKSSKHFNTETKSAKKIVRKTPKRNVKKTLKKNSKNSKNSKKTKKQRKLKGGKRMIGGANPFDVECKQTKDPSSGDDVADSMTCTVKKATAPAAASGPAAPAAPAGMADCLNDIDDIVESINPDKAKKKEETLKNYLNKMIEFLMKSFDLNDENTNTFFEGINKSVAANSLQDTLNFIIMIKRTLATVIAKQDIVKNDACDTFQDMISIFYNFDSDTNSLTFKWLDNLNSTDYIDLNLNDASILKNNEIFQTILNFINDIMKQIFNKYKSKPDFKTLIDNLIADGNF